MRKLKVNPYDLIASSYKEIAAKRKEYIESVNSIILKYTPKNVKSMLDIGSGDGQRGMFIAKKLNIKDLTLCDSSREMVKLCKKLKPQKVLLCKAEDLPTDKQYNIITCLWNVLGHIESEQKRIETLINMRKSLTKNGLIFFDVNNRYNGSAYGIREVMKRMIIDFIKPDITRGDTSYNWIIKDKKVPASGHLFTTKEIENMLIKAKLSVKLRKTIHYETGKVSDLIFKGQLLYILSL